MIIKTEKREILEFANQTVTSAEMLIFRGRKSLWVKSAQTGSVSEVCEIKPLYRGAGRCANCPHSFIRIKGSLFNWRGQLLSQWTWGLCNTDSCQMHTDKIQHKLGKLKHNRWALFFPIYKVLLNRNLTRATKCSSLNRWSRYIQKTTKNSRAFPGLTQVDRWSKAGREFSSSSVALWVFSRK